MQKRKSKGFGDSVLSRPKLSEKVWITQKELNKYLLKVVWITGCTELEEALRVFISRVKVLIKRSGFNFTFLYLKEVNRLVIRYLAGHGEPRYQIGNVMVKRDHIGLPTILPSSTRRILTEGRENQVSVACILSVVSVFRVFPTTVKPKLGTIIEPFSGLTRTIESSKLKLAVAEIIRGKLYISPPKLIRLETASPNTIKSTGGASIDALAFFGNKGATFALNDLLIFLKGRKFVGWLLGLKFLASPFIFVYKGMGVWETPLLGKLSVVYDQAGKARVIAITNWGIQLCLKPLHNSLFRVLRGIDEDGTFDQLKPFNSLIQRVKSGQTFHSFDLSAATDRLPIDLQRDILNIMRPTLGDKGHSLLDIEGSYRQGKSHNMYKYAVGQPMGAYSSGAMLAITHHVIVKVAAQKRGLYKFKDYCILGDDVVIANDAVAEEYYSIMNALGVSINLSKSVQSKDFAEFAKNGKGPGVQITPIGPGLTLRFVRSKKYVTAYLGAAGKLNFYQSLREALARVMDLKHMKMRSEFDHALGSSFGINSFVMNDESHIDENSIMGCFSSRTSELPFLRYHIHNALMQMSRDDNREAQIKLDREKDFFYRNWGKIFVSRPNGPLRLLEAGLKLVGPGFGVYAYSFEKAQSDIDNFSLLNEDASWQNIRNWGKVASLVDITTIDWTRRTAIKDQSARVKRLYSEILRSQEEVSNNEFGYDDHTFW